MVEEKCLEANQKHEYIIDEIEWFYPQMSQSLEYFGERNQMVGDALYVVFPRVCNRFAVTNKKNMHIITPLIKRKRGLIAPYINPLL